MDILNAQALDGGRLKIVEGVQVFRACVVDQVTKAGEPRVVRTAGGQRCGPIGPLGREHARVHRGVVPHKVQRGLVPDIARQALRHGRQLKPLRGFRRGLIERLSLHPSGRWPAARRSPPLGRDRAGAPQPSARRSAPRAARRRHSASALAPDRRGELRARAAAPPAPDCGHAPPGGSAPHGAGGKLSTSQASTSRPVPAASATTSRSRRANMTAMPATTMGPSPSKPTPPGRAVERAQRLPMPRVEVPRQLRAGRRRNIEDPRERAAAAQEQQPRQRQPRARSHRRLGTPSPPDMHRCQSPPIGQPPLPRGRSPGCR